MLKNFWWPVGFAHEVSAKPKRWEVLSNNLVVYRAASGKTVVLNDACGRCGSPLSSGRVEDEKILCPKDNLAHHPDGHIEGVKNSLEAYPTQEKYGMLFIFVGELAESERLPIPELPYFGDPEYKVVRGKFNWDVHYARGLENGVDAAHTPFVHGGAFGNPDEPEIEEYEVEHFPNSARAVIHLTPQPSKGLWRYLYKQQKTRVKTLVQWWMPNLSLLEVHIPLGKLFIFNAHVPVTDFKTVSHYTAFRTFFKGGWADSDTHRRVVKIFNQDKKVVEAQRPELLPYDLGAELHVKSDALQIAFRKTRQEFFDRGWGLYRHDQPTQVLPSPLKEALER